MYSSFPLTHSYPRYYEYGRALFRSVVLRSEEAVEAEGEGGEDVKPQSMKDAEEEVKGEIKAEQEAAIDGEDIERDDHEDLGIAEEVSGRGGMGGGKEGRSVVVPMMEIYPMLKSSMICVHQHGDRKQRLNAS